MTDWLIQLLFHSVVGWLGFVGIIVVICGVIAWFVPSLRLAMLSVAGAALAVGAAYTKGNRDRAALEQKRKDTAVAKARKDYDAIDKRPDTPSNVADRLRDGTF